MDTMSRLRASFRSSTRRKKKKKQSEDQDKSNLDDCLGVAFEEIELEIRPRESFRPSDLRILFSIPSRGMEVLSVAPSLWEPSLKSSLNGVSVWVPPFPLALTHSCQIGKAEEEDAYFLLEDFRKKKRKALAKTRVSLKDFENTLPKTLKLRPLSRKILSASLNLSFDTPLPSSSSHRRKESLLPLESLSLTEDLSSELTPKSVDVSSLENIPDLPSKESPLQMKYNALNTEEDIISIDHQKEEKDETKSIASSSASILNSPPSSCYSKTGLNSPPGVERASPSIIVQPKPPLIPIFPSSPPPSAYAREESSLLASTEEDLSDLILIPQDLLSVSVNNNTPTTSQRDLSSSPTPCGSDNDLLEWSKERLRVSDRIKITNLTSSWRNGIGYCVLLHSKFPELVPLAKLENHNQESNRKLASELVAFLGGKPLVSSPNLAPSKADIIQFLKEIKQILSDKEITAEDAKRWKESSSQWFREDENDSSPSTPLDLIGASKESSPEKSPQKSPTKNEKAKRLIQEAHSNFGGVTLRRNKGGTPSTSPDRVPPEVRQSVILLKKELVSLAEEEERIKREKNELEAQLRTEVSGTPSPSAQNKKLKRWIELVNERHSLVRRQMQLNIKEKESVINGKLEDLRFQLREFEEISETLKTEEMRNEEQALIEELVRTVNEKNELVHHLDNEEKAIDEDERIKTMLEEGVSLSGNSLNNIKNLKVAGVGADECVVM